MTSSATVFPYKTEKTFKLANKGIYTFATLSMIPKDQIKNEIKLTYNVDVVSLSGLVRNGKKKTNWAKRTSFERPSFIKVYVRLKDGQSLDLFK